LQAAKGRTTLLIAHRLSTVRHCDKIVVMHEGQVAEEGTHAELIALKGKYAELWSMQSDEDGSGTMAIEDPGPIK